MCDTPTELQEKGQRPTREKDASTLGREVPVSVQACSWVVCKEQRGLRVWSRPEGGRSQPCKGASAVGIVAGLGVIMVFINRMYLGCPWIF